MSRDKLIEKMARASHPVWWEYENEMTAVYGRGYVDAMKHQACLLNAAALTALEAAGMAMRNDVLEETIVKLQNMPRSHDNKSDYWSGYSNAINNAVDRIRALARRTSEKENG